MKEATNLLACSIAGLVLLAICAPKSSAYPSYSVNEDATYCGACHGDFRASPYISLSDGQNWGDDLHDIHRQTMLSFDCTTCHMTPGSTPVSTDVSGGGAGFEPISCVGCHGRNEDMGGDILSEGRGAGLRQHHWNSGITTCANCHSDADPANYTPVGEDVPPSYYFTPDANHPDKPTDPCSPTGEEDYAGATEGLDNDGDGLYDTADPDCAAGCPNTCGDINGDGSVDLADFVLFAGCFGLDPGVSQDCTCSDMNGDGGTDLADFVLFAGLFGSPSTNTPPDCP